MTNFEKMTVDDFAKKVGDFLEDNISDCGDCPFDKFCSENVTFGIKSCHDIVKLWANTEVPILDEVEKEYLKAVLAPWLKRDNKITIEKCKSRKEEKWWLEILLAKKDSGVAERISLPSFHSKKMYADMEENKYYTVEELGLR